MRKLALAVGFVACGGGGGGGQDAGSGAPPGLEVADGSGAALGQISFAATAVDTSLAQVVHVTNAGTEPTLALSVAATDSADFATDAATTTCAASLAPGASCDVGLVFHPSAMGDLTGTLVVTPQSGAALTVVLAGVGVAADFQIVPSGIDLGDLDLGSTGSASFTITNAASVAGTVGPPTISGAGWTLVSSTCGSALAVGASCTIDVAFASSALGTPDAAVTIALDGVARPISLVAAGTSKLTVVLAGSGSGEVTSEPAGIACQTACVGHFADVVMLTAQPADGSTFAGWSVPACTTTECDLAAAPTARTITATFEPAAGSDGSGSGSAGSGSDLGSDTFAPN